MSVAASITPRGSRAGNTVMMSLSTATIVMMVAGLPLALVLRPGMQPAAERGRTIILLRHAEKEAGTDPALTERGMKRAEAVAALLGKSGADVLISSEFKRTRMTLEPLAKVLGRKVESVPAAEMEKLLERLRGAADGSTTVICGHSNTVPALLKALGAEPPRLDAAHMIPDAEFGRLYILHLPPATSSAKPLLTELDLGA